MTDTIKKLASNNSPLEEPLLEGIYGYYRITAQDQKEVQNYRFALLVCGLSLSAGLLQWLAIGPALASLWMLPFSIGLGLALNWIHIYLRPLHKALQFLWAIGSIGSFYLLVTLGSDAFLSNLVINPGLILIVGPLFAALTGVGFKEFFCFRRPEAIGLTILVPIALLGHLSTLLNGSTVMILLLLSSLLLVILSLRKFGMNAADDVGDKSVFDFLKNKELNNAL